MLNKNVLQIVKPVMGLFFGQKQIDERSEEFGEMRSHFYFWNSEKFQHAVSLISLNCSILKLVYVSRQKLIGLYRSKIKDIQNFEATLPIHKYCCEGIILVIASFFFSQKKKLLSP